MNKLLNNADFCGRVAFIGQTLGPFFLEDPQKGSIASSFEAIKNLDVFEAAEEWPFVEAFTAQALLEKMQSGLDEGVDSDALVWEYRRLFVGPAIKPAPPWGSVYTDRECVVFGQSTLQLSRWMKENGIERLSDDKTPEDHIGLLLLLMAWMVDTKPERLEDYLRLHVLTWSSHFLDLLADAAEQPFYEGLAKLTKESLEGIQDALGIEVDYPRFYR